MRAQVWLYFELEKEAPYKKEASSSRVMNWPLCFPREDIAGGSNE